MPRVSIVVGTRPNFVKISQFEKEFNAFGDFFDFELVHTGQHSDFNMSLQFFEQLQIKTPDVFLNASGSANEQIEQITERLQAHYESCQPDMVIVVGDVNSTRAAAVAAKKANCTIAHLESGLRSFDETMPEEFNRIQADRLADIHYITLPEAKINLQKEGYTEASIVNVGNTMIDTLKAFTDDIARAHLPEGLDVSSPFVLATMHRPSNVDGKEDLADTLSLLEAIAEICPVYFPAHPRTRKKIQELNWKAPANIRLLEPIDYLAFQRLTRSAKFVVTDSGGVQEETTYYGVPCITVRPNTERNYTVTHGTNAISNRNRNEILNFVRQIMDGNWQRGEVPENWDGNATLRVVKHLHSRLS